MMLKQTTYIEEALKESLMMFINYLEVFMAHFLPEDVHLGPVVCVLELELIRFYDML